MNLLNPLFWYQKRGAILSRLNEIPETILWKHCIYPLLKRGFLYHPDFDKASNLQGIHEGKSALLLGNGPSVKLEELELLNGVDDLVVFGANRIHLAYEKTTFRPSYLVSADEVMIADFGEEMAAANGEREVFYFQRLKPNLHAENYTWLKLIHGRPFRFSHDLRRGSKAAGGSLISALQLGYFMGIRKFYLYGVDHNFRFEASDSIRNGATGEGNHFLSNYRNGKVWQVPQYELVEEAFIKCDKELREQGGFLVNSTNGGRLEVLERVPFMDFLVRVNEGK